MLWWPEEIRAGKPPDRIKVSEWAERRRVLTNAAARGPYRCEMVPFLVPVMDVATDPNVETMVFCKSAQIGGTDAILNILGYFLDQDPSSIMFVCSDEDTAIEEMSRQRVQPMFQDSSDLKHLIDKDRWTKRELIFINGARLTFGWASSVARLASRPYRIVAFDEIDKDGYRRTSNEADAISLGRERTNTFANRLILLLSTPTLEEGRIWQELENCEIVYDWHVPCPHCGQLQLLRWDLKNQSGCVEGKYRSIDGTYQPVGNVVWEGGRDATRDQIKKAGYKCGSCEKVWSTVEKNQAVQNGQIVPRSEPTGDEIKVGFHVNRLYSLFPGGRLENLVSDWLFAVNSGDWKQIQGFINSSLAEPWKQVTVNVELSHILGARTDVPKRTVPKEAIALTCGIDNQQIGFWYVIRAWDQFFTSWLIDYGFVIAWEDVEQILFENVYPDEDGSERRIWRAGIDTGGGAQEGGLTMTEETYWWLRQNGIGRGCRVWGTKGSSTPLPGKLRAGKPLDKTPSGKPIPGGLQLVSLNTGALKDTYHYRLNNALTGEDLPQSAYLHAETGEDYARQIRAEEKQKDRQGREMWVHVRGDNHLFDCEVICHALVDPEWPGGGLNLYRAMPSQQSQHHKPKPIKQNRRW